MADETPNDAKEQQEEPELGAATEAAAPIEAEQETSTDEAATEERAKPKPRRRAKPKAAAEDVKGEAEVAEADEADEAEEAKEEEQPKPARRRARARSAGSGEEPEPQPERAPEPEPVYYDEGPARAVRAQAKYVRTSARKARLVCDHLRGKSVEEARAILAFNPRGVARDWSKVLESAIANAENNHELVAEDLVVREAFADEGPTIKRFQPRARGRAASIRKRTSHLTITLSPDRR